MNVKGRGKSSRLTDGCSKDDESCPVILNEFSHDEVDTAGRDIRLFALNGEDGRSDVAIGY